MPNKQKNNSGDLIGSTEQQRIGKRSKVFASKKFDLLNSYTCPLKS
jgi:hypothetical protein